MTSTLLLNDEFQRISSSWFSLKPPKALQPCLKSFVDGKLDFSNILRAPNDLRGNVVLCDDLPSIMRREFFSPLILKCVAS